MSVVVKSVNSEVRLYPGIFSSVEFKNLEVAIDWQHESLMLYGRQVRVPRLVAFYGDAGVHYRYSGLDHLALPWLHDLREIRDTLQSEFSQVFNSVLANFYRDGSDHMGWHQDNEPALGSNPVIASVSLGQTRRFKLRHKQTREVMAIDLTHGDVLLMQGACQHEYEHTLTKTAKPVAGRINLTFRQINR